MKIAFFISFMGDTDLALKTINSLEKKGQHDVIVIPLTKAAQLRAENAVILKRTLPDILQISSDQFPEGTLSPQQLENMAQYIKHQQIDYAYIGVPSVNNEIPFQIAMTLNIPVLMAYEFMFKPDNHCLWKHMRDLSNKSNIKWALPLATAKKDFAICEENLYITGHLSIDNASSTSMPCNKSSNEIKELLQVSLEQSFSFISSTTQPVEIDAEFLDCLFTELKKHPTMQVRLGLHPGIQDLDAYLQKILTIYKKHSEIAAQFKIILPENLVGKIKTPELTINEPQYQDTFLRVNVSGSEAAFAADRNTQAVAGAFTNQATLEGKPTYVHQQSKPYLPSQYFSENFASFFTGKQQPPRTKKDLGLDEMTAPEKYAQIIIGTY